MNFLTIDGALSNHEIPDDWPRWYCVVTDLNGEIVGGLFCAKSPDGVTHIYDEIMIPEKLPILP